MAIHVQLRHEPAPAENVFDAPPDHDDDDDDEVYVDAAPLEELQGPPPKALPARAPVSEAFFTPRVLASEAAAGRQSRTTGILRYLATRALNAYLSQSSFASVGTSEPRMLDVHA